MDEKIIIDDIEKIYSKVNLSDLMGKSILITGGTGLIGSYIIYTLKRLNEGADKKATVYVVVHNGVPNWLKFIETDSNYKILKGDLSDYNFLVSLPCTDYIVHAAGYGQPGLFMVDKMKTIRLNTLATDVLLSKVPENGKFLFVSTSEVYSGSKNVPYQEQDSGRTTPQHSRGCYIEGKRCGEAICMAYKEKGVDVKIARVSLAYGPCFKQGDRRVLNNFIEKSMHENIEMLDSGQSKRIYCYVSDTVEMLWKVILEGNDVVYNIGGIEETSVKCVADIVARLSGVNVCVPENGEGLKDAPKVVAMSIDKVKKEFGKNDFICLEEGLARTINWYKDEYGMY